MVVKFIFQFSFWPWSKNVIKSWNDWSYIIGISTSEVVKCSVADENCSTGDQHLPKGYYAKFELAVLLSIFIHRTVLKVCDFTTSKILVCCEYKPFILFFCYPIWANQKWNESKVSLDEIFPFYPSYL